ncbi:magnesium/cobalt transporter CorA [Inquilinus limosus]|uniref:Magnesium transport protein CorA n=1 Tax=Inquilinus limosus TaxID=171674 RepID=A0A211ZQG8_9PROT|nr:magnesium/cobalt transporter CorA [Inquilinus limosus]OWJ67513.1 magnesium and cobalt transport protein CorA [Inquilinus limosus]
MLRIYTLSNTHFTPVEPVEGAGFPTDTVWIDLFNPTAEEERLAEKQLGLFLPTREEMQEIEASSRLYQEDGGMFMTASVLYATETDAPGTAPITFVLKGQTLVTIRYAEPKSFAGFIAHAERQPMLCPTGSATLIGLLEAIVDRTADILERVGGEVDVLSQRIFKVNESVHRRTTNEELEANLKQIGRSQNLVSKVRESLVSLARLLSFLAVGDATKDKAFRIHQKSLSRDVLSLTDHATYIGNNITFLLDASMGMINIEQNAIIKIFSVAAVVFLPPTLVASIYGMNFDIMPELKWAVGYPFALGLMVLSAVLPYLWFKRKGWL